jgi:hypothetical protein
VIVAPPLDMLPYVRLQLGFVPTVVDCPDWLIAAQPAVYGSQRAIPCCPLPGPIISTAQAPVMVSDVFIRSSETATSLPPLLSTVERVKFTDVPPAAAGATYILLIWAARCAAKRVKQNSVFMGFLFSFLEMGLLRNVEA